MRVDRRPAAAAHPCRRSLRQRPCQACRLEAWLTYGPPRDCIAHLQRYAASGCRRITFRICTMGDAMAQLRRLVEEVLPFV
jgi:hypothetical protein